MKLFFSTSLMILCLQTFVFSATIQFPKGESRNTHSSDFWKHPSSAKRYNESWNYMIVADNGTRIHLTYSLMKVPLKGFRSGTNISIVKFNGKNYSVGRDYPSERMIENRAQKTIRIHSGKSDFSMTGLPGNGHKILFETDKNEGYHLDLTFSNATKGMVAGDGIFHLGSHSVGQVIHIPYARVKGSLSVGKDTIQISGNAFMDHIWQSAMASDLIKHELQLFRSKKDHFVADLFVASCDYKSQVFGYGILKNTQILFPKQISSGNKQFTCKQNPFSSFDIQWKGDFPTMSFRRHDFQKFSPLDKVDGWFKKKALKTIMGGEPIFYRGADSKPEGLIHYNVSTIR